MDLKSKEFSSPSTMGIEAAEGEQNVVTRHVPIKGQRRNLGRQARKRRKKYLEIEAAASAFVAATAAAATSTNQNSNVVPTKLETTTNYHIEEQKGASTNTASSNSILPTDRSYVLNDVRRRTLLSESDRRELIRQLGYLPGNALQVVARVEDAFSTEDLQRLLAAAVTKMTARTNASESTFTPDVASSNVSKDTNNFSSTTRNANENSNGKKTNKTTTGTMATMIQTMMKEPLVVKLYPLVLRDESSSTKRRRKRRRDENEDPPEPYGTNTNATNHNNSKMVREDQSSLPAASARKKSSPLMEPFPTIYWVTHPLIKAFISKLELDKLNVRFEQRLLDEGITKGPEKSADEGICRSSPLEAMKRAHRSYGRERRELLSQRDMEYVKSRRWYEDSPPSNNDNNNKKMTPSTAPFGDGCGVAGIRNPKAVKCLHGHAAHYWSGNLDNVVGYWVEQELKMRKNLVQ